jgi:hypothetical protein
MQVRDGDLLQRLRDMHASWAIQVSPYPKP